MFQCAKTKRERGQFFTKVNSFGHPEFQAWARRAGLPNATVLEPFAGAGDILRMLESEGLLGDFAAFDIEPQAANVGVRDTLDAFPVGFDVVVTNPPYLARNSAAKRGLPFPMTEHDDLYKLAIEQCLAHARFVAAIIPASFLTSGMFRERLDAVLCLGAGMFDDTEHPVCLALWGPDAGDGVVVRGEDTLGTLDGIASLRPRPDRRFSLRFNAPDGAIGLRGVDGTKGPTIRFCHGDEVEGVSSESRSNTRISLGLPHDRDLVESIVHAANLRLRLLREASGDVLLTAFKGTRQDGCARRRLDYGLARGLLDMAIADVLGVAAPGIRPAGMVALPLQNAA